MISAILGFIIVILILVTFHEAGHLLMARLAKVRVLCFAVGFGPTLWSFKDKNDTEYALKAIPLGGYVKMLDDELPSGSLRTVLPANKNPEEPASTPSTPVASSELSFPAASPLWRIGIALGGPAANFVLAFLVFWFLAAVYATTVTSPYVVETERGSPAALAGLPTPVEIEQVDGRDVATFQDLNLRLYERLGETGAIVLTTSKGTTPIPILQWLVDQEDPDLLSALGLVVGVAAKIGEVVDDSPAAAAGLQPGDVIVQIDDLPILTWHEFRNAIGPQPGKRLEVWYERDGARQRTTMTPATRIDNEGSEYGFVGVAVQLETIEHNVWTAVPNAFVKTYEVIRLTVVGAYKMVVGDLSSRNLGGPIMIADYAGDMLAANLESFLVLIGLLSVSLGVINLLPIPILDGGHVVFGLFELVTKKPISERVQLIGVRIGLGLVGGLICLAFYNDLLRVLG